MSLIIRHIFVHQTNCYYNLFCLINLSKGIEMNIKLTTPCQVLEANAGFHREMSLVNSESETIEQELSWGVDSQIEVKGRHVGEAKLIILEEEYCGNFTIKTHIRYLGSVLVLFINYDASILSLFPYRPCS
jgi:hypothetical protein